MHHTKKTRLASLKAETAEPVTKLPRKQIEKLDLWEELALNKPIINSLQVRSEAESCNAVPPSPVATASILEPAVIAPTISPKPEPVKQYPIESPAERQKMYRWPDGYYLANGKLISADDPEYATVERFKIFRPPSGWVAMTEDGTQREYKIEVETDFWDRAELKRVNRIVSHHITRSTPTHIRGPNETRQKANNVSNITEMTG
jgi:hypothetical protein